MFDYIFKDKKTIPCGENIIEYCGKYAESLLNCINNFADDFEWKFYSKKTGWTQKYLVNNKTLCFVQPYEGKIEFVINLNKKDENNIMLSSSFFEKIKEDIKSLRQYREGKTFRFFIESNEDIITAEQLMKVKLEINQYI